MPSRARAAAPDIPGSRRAELWKEKEFLSPLLESPCFCSTPSTKRSPSPSVPPSNVEPDPRAAFASLQAGGWVPRLTCKRPLPGRPIGQQRLLTLHCRKRSFQDLILLTFSLADTCKPPRPDTGNKPKP